MHHQTLQQIAATADLVEPPFSSPRSRLNRWAELLAARSELLCSIPEVEYGPRIERDMYRADNSPLSIAYADPALRQAGLCGDRVGDAVKFFGLSHRELHRLVCTCHHGRTVQPFVMAGELRQLADTPGWVRHGTPAAAISLGLMAAVAAVALL
jgi:hypothetical protein